MSESFPWARLMHFGIGTLQLSPQEFWRNTLRELMFAQRLPSQPLLRQNLDEMIRLWPD